MTKENCFCQYYNFLTAGAFVIILSMSGILRYHDITYKILGAILKLGVRSVTWTVSELASAVFKNLSKSTFVQIQENDKNAKNEIRRLIYYACNRGYLNDRLQTTQSGAQRLKKLNFQSLEMTQPWDGKWRLVMYDIPENKRNARAQIRRLIKQLGFVQLQQSVWAHPLPCLEQFELIKEANKLEDSLVLIETSRVAGIRKHQGHFEKLYPKIQL